MAKRSLQLLCLFLIFLLVIQALMGLEAKKVDIKDVSQAPIGSWVIIKGIVKKISDNGETWLLSVCDSKGRCVDVSLYKGLGPQPGIGDEVKLTGKRVK